MNKVLVGAIAAGLVSSAVILGDGTAKADDVLMVPGTSPPSGPASKFYHFKPQWVPLIGQKYYNNPGVTDNPGVPGVNPKIIAYPAVNPTSATGSMPVGKSVAIGANNLDAAIRGNHGPMSVVGLSQGAEVMTEEQLRLQGDPTAPPPDQITFIKVSDPAIVLRRLFRPGTHLPIFDYTVPPLVESQYDTVNVVSQYDFVGDPPDRWWNLLAVINSGMGLQHTMVAFSDPASVPPENIRVRRTSLGGTETTYVVPLAELPLVTQLRQWGVPGPVADEMERTLRPQVDKAYFRHGGDYPPPPALPGRILSAIPENALGAVHIPSGAVPAVSVPGQATTSGLGAGTTHGNLSNLGNVFKGANIGNALSGLTNPKGGKAPAAKGNGGGNGGQPPKG